MIKTAHEKYITLRSGEVAIPLSNTRTNENGETEAEVLCFMQSGAFRNVWILRKDIREDLLTPTDCNTFSLF